MIEVLQDEYISDKKVNEQIIKYIKEICGSGSYDISFADFNIDISFALTPHYLGGTNCCCENEWDVCYKTKLTEKNGKFHCAIYSNAHPMYIAKFAVYEYLNAKIKYDLKQKSEIKERKANKLFSRLFKTTEAINYDAFDDQ